jgi:hypothetical protein
MVAFPVSLHSSRLKLIVMDGGATCKRIPGRVHHRCTYCRHVLQTATFQHG